MTSMFEKSINRIRKFPQLSGVTRFRLACMANVPEGCVRNIDSEKWNPTLSTLTALNEAIPAEFNVDEGIAEATKLEMKK